MWLEAAAYLRVQVGMLAERGTWAKESPRHRRRQLSVVERRGAWVATSLAGCQTKQADYYLEESDTSGVSVAIRAGWETKTKDNLQRRGLGASVNSLRARGGV